VRRIASLVLACVIVAEAMAHAQTNASGNAGSGDLAGATSTLNALNATCSVKVSGRASVGGMIASGTLAGTVVAEVSPDNGTSWFPSWFDLTNASKRSSLTFTNPNAATFSTIIFQGGTTDVRVRVSAFTSGAASCFLVATSGADPSVLFAQSAGQAPPPAFAVIAGVGTGLTGGQINGGIIACDRTASINVSTATTTNVVTGVASQTVYVCAYVIEIQGVATTAATGKLVSGTGATCTTPTDITPTYTGGVTANVPIAISIGSGLGMVTKAGAAGQNVCFTSTATAIQKVHVTYAIF
jgi:hypothetical protein